MSLFSTALLIGSGRSTNNILILNIEIVYCESFVYFIFKTVWVLLVSRGLHTMLSALFCQSLHHVEIAFVSKAMY